MTVVTEVSDVIRVPDSGSKSFTADLRPVRTVESFVDGPGPVDASAVFAVFAKQAGEGIAQVGVASPRSLRSGLITVERAAAVVTYESVQQVETGFTYRCGGVAVSGVVRSWRRPRSGIMQCDAKKPPAVDVVREVAALAC
ncbi:hypothetical protein [Actinoplanes sp. TFC3]|uniref:hypothetical protein n=1 Tax=Actinoplanes sp. TFC3 TaxID=1710355 RepID=UPI00082E7766|nr:hypothetical protein [Actinoplanes sp. TFC3]